MRRNIALYPWVKFVQNLVFWQATWFLYFESRLSAAEAILLYIFADLAATVLEVPSGYMSDRLGRRLTLLLGGVCGLRASLLLVQADGFPVFAIANLLLGASVALYSGTDSSLLFESLRAEGRAAEMEAASLKAWRFGFIALALSALGGGFLAQADESLPFVATALAAGVVVVLTALLHEPPRVLALQHRETVRALRDGLRDPILRWLLCLSVLMYVFSHIPFVFGQPFIREALTGLGYAGQAPVVSGTVSFTMMAVSVAVSLIAQPLRHRLGLPGLLLVAFGMQVALTAALATSDNAAVIALLFLRMVPESLSQPFILSRIQPLLQDSARATYLSLQSLTGRLMFAATLGTVAKGMANDTLPYAAIQGILAVYAAAGVAFLIALAATARGSRV